MFQSIKDYFKRLSEEGIRFPYARNATTGLPSVTLLFAYLTFFLSVISCIALHFKDVSTATWTSICFWAIATVFYRMGKLDKFKVDLDDKSIELDAEDNNNEGEK